MFAFFPFVYTCFCRSSSKYEHDYLYEDVSKLTFIRFTDFLCILRLLRFLGSIDRYSKRETGHRVAGH